MQERNPSYRQSASRPAISGDARWIFTIGAAFVLCWASGFVVPRVLIPYSEPFTFVALRNVGAALLLIAITLLLGSPWPHRRVDIFGLIWAGALLQGFSLMGLYWAVYHGLPVGIAALIGGLQPALTAVFAAMLISETAGPAQWVGVMLGFVGLTVAVWPKITLGSVGVLLPLSALLGVAFMAYGTIYQKRFAGVGDNWTRTALMFIGAVVPAALGSTSMEQAHVVWNGSMLAVYVWSVVALAIGTTMSLLFLIDRGQAARTASLIYLVPPTSALMAYIWFGETMGATQFAGFLISVMGVALVQFRGPARDR